VSIDEVIPAEWDRAFHNYYEQQTQDKRLTFTSDYSGPDNVTKPLHYTDSTIECIDYIQDRLSKDAYEGFLEGNITKYLHRWRIKNGVEDLRKARWYLDRLIKEAVS
jgi:hypothetical protein